MCSRQYLAPIDLEWTYQLNDFVYRSLTKHSGLIVLWSLGFLQDQSWRDSFWYLPEVELYEDDDDLTKKVELDILCVRDGLFHAAEIKLSAALFVNSPGEVDKFVAKMNTLRPDVAMLIFERYSDNREDVEAKKAALAMIADDVRKRLAPLIELKLIVADDIPGFNDHTADLGRTGKRTHEAFYR